MKGFPIPQENYYRIQYFVGLLLPSSTDQCQQFHCLLKGNKGEKNVAFPKKSASISVTAYISLYKS